MGRYSRPLKVFILCIGWYSMSSANNIIGKKMMKQYPYPLTITLAHMIANSILIYPVLMVAGLSHQTKTPHSLFLRFLLPLGIGKLLSSVAAHVSIWKVSISYAHTGKLSFLLIRNRLILGRMKVDETCCTCNQKLRLIWTLLVNYFCKCWSKMDILGNDSGFTRRGF